MSEGPAKRGWFGTLILIVVAVAVVLVGVTLGSLALFRGTNCGGNSAALAICETYVSFLGGWTSEHRGQQFHYKEADPEIQKQITRIADTRWIRSAKILANVHGVRIDPAAPRQIVVVCDRAFDNVPDYLLWPSPMAHAVGYSTGESGLISPEEFKRLDLSGFVDLRTEIPRISD